MECIVHLPSPAVSALVKNYWYLYGNGFTGHLERVIPSGHVSIMFHLGEPFRMSGPGAKQPGCYISGISSSFSDVTVTGTTDVCCIVFHPHGLAPLVPFPLSEVGGGIVASGDTGCRWLERLHERLAGEKDLRERTSIIEKTLLSILCRARRITSLPAVGRAVETMTSGIYDVRRLAGEAFLGERQFNRVFRQTTGISPKKMARIIRFQRSLLMMQNLPAATLTAIAHESGYWDQSHFILDFNEFTGYSPREYRKLWHPYSDFFA